MTIRTLTRHTLAAAAAALLWPLALGAPALAQGDFPSRPVRIIVPFAAGTLPDNVARLVADKLQQRWSQPIIVEVRTGATGNVGAEAVVRSAPDGHTLLVTPPPPVTINHFTFAQMPFKRSDMAPVSILVTAPNVLIVRPGFPAANLDELVALAKRSPGKLTYASTGRGSTQFLTMEWLRMLAGVDIAHVPYAKGLAPAIIDVLGGHVDMLFGNLADTSAQVKDGKIRAMAVASARPVAELPGVPAVAERYPGFEAIVWYGMIAPAGTPAATIARISKDVGEAMRMPDVVARLTQQSVTPVGSTPAEAKATIDADADRWQKVIQLIGLKPE